LGLDPVLYKERALLSLQIVSASAPLLP
jgi:hypothetical protein